MSIIQGLNKPIDMPVTVEDRDALVNQYIRHRDTSEIFKIVEVGTEGVTAYKAEGFGSPVSPDSEQYLITWASLKYKHVIMVHVTDVNVKPEHLL